MGPLLLLLAATPTSRAELSCGAPATSGMVSQNSAM